MKLELLDLRNPAYNAAYWDELYALSDGGQKFHTLLRTFLPQNPFEPDDLYRDRLRQANFRSYTGSIINLYNSWLFAAEFSVKAYQKDSDKPLIDVDNFYGRFQENTGAEQTLSHFMRDRFREAMVSDAAYWLIELPSNEGEAPVNRKDYEARKLGHARLVPLDRKELIDWDEDSEGQMAWALTHTVTTSRPSILDPRGLITETWRLYDKEMVTTFSLQYNEKDGRPTSDTDVPITDQAPHGFKRVPIVDLVIPEYLCIGRQTYDTQLEYFRLDNALSWAIRRTCYAVPVLKTESDENVPTMGVGYAMQLGVNDDFAWAAPPSDAFEVIRRARDNVRDELYRIVHQMQASLDNNAETVGRSAQSKEIDSAATRIMLNAYGGFISQAIEETYEMISEARDEIDYEWSVEGFSGYDTATASTLIANTMSAKEMGVPSKTFMKEISTKVAMALLPESDQRVKDTIREEISAYDFTVSGETEATTLAADAAEAAEEAPPAKEKRVDGDTPSSKK